MRGADFLEVAKDLAKAQSEAALRSALSHAYYGLFNAAAQVLNEWDSSCPKVQARMVKFEIAFRIARVNESRTSFIL